MLMGRPLSRAKPKIILQMHNAHRDTTLSQLVHQKVGSAWLATFKNPSTLDTEMEWADAECMGAWQHGADWAMTS